MTRWAKIFNTCSEAEAIVVKGLLEGQGIPCLISSSAVPQFPVTVDGLAEVCLFVPPGDRARAEEIISKSKPLQTDNECNV